MSERRYQRWDRSQVRQHKLMMVSFSLLVATGLPLRYAGSATSQVLAQHLGGASMAGLVHRIAAVGLIVCSLWHCVYLLGRWRRRQLSTAMLPSREDLVEVRDTFRWLFDPRAPEPRYGRYNFIEKFEYWAVVWGSVVMVATGFILWFPVGAAGWVTALGIDLAKVVHGYEAVLAALSIAIWHMYHAHLRRDVFPMNRLWLSGTLSATEMRHHHPKELAALEAAEQSEAHDDSPQPAASPLAAADSDDSGGAVGGV
ncbi:MAG: cytochrome b/b6 domain-containing protein [Fimbriimonadaceae bacterium]|nr:cytochrome b/b6 domain-containing protein [Fimbriimonadaceae bacterium]